MSAKRDVLPEIKQLAGALIFGAHRPVSVKEIRRCLAEVAETEDGRQIRDYRKVREPDVRAAVQELATALEQAKVGFHISEVAGGYRLQSDAACGPLLRHFLQTGRPQRLSRPSLETLAIIAYRQPVTRAQIEAVRGVSVDHVVKSLMELQLVKIVGRSALPGRPFMYGTTHAFLEHFGLTELSELGKLDPLLPLGPAEVSGPPGRHEVDEDAVEEADAGSEGVASDEQEEGGSDGAPGATGTGAPDDATPGAAENDAVEDGRQ